MKKVIPSIIAASILFTLSISVANAKSYVNTQLVVDGSIKSPPLATKHALWLQEAENRLVPQTLTQEEIDRRITSQSSNIQPDFGFGIVNTAFTNKVRSTTYCSATATVYNTSAEYISEFYGMIDIYKQFQSDGPYVYDVTQVAFEEDIPPTTTYGYSLDRYSYAHYGLKQFWDFGGHYDVDGSSETPLSHVYWNCL